MILVPSKPPITLQVPTLNDESSDYRNLFSLWKKIRTLENQDVIFEFSNCQFLRQNAVAFLGGLTRLIELRGDRVDFAWHTLQENIKANLRQNGFIDVFQGTQHERPGNSLPYREYHNQQMDKIVVYLESYWLGRGWVEVDSNHIDAVIQNALELFSNALEHSASPIGVFACGQHYPKLNQLCLTLTDFGVGIPPNVRRFLNQSQLCAADAIKWAFQPGNTTRANRIAGGMGLDALKKFITKTKGKIEIYSHDGYALIDHNQEIYKKESPFFEGTLVNITIQCDSTDDNPGTIEVSF